MSRTRRLSAAGGQPPEPGPLVSCVMITQGRAAFVRQSIAYFQAQDYPRLELVIVYEQEGDLPSPLPSSPPSSPPSVRAIRYHQVAPGQSLGAKRNAGVAEAIGQIIVQWDDDDWYAAERVSRQVAPILAGTADITALRARRFFELSSWKLWTCSAALHARMFVEDVAGGTLAYRRELWGAGVRYPATNLREDADFLLAAMRAGARLSRLDDEELFVYVRHGTNTWRFASGAFMTPDDWQELGEPTWPLDVQAFYRQQARGRRAETSPGTPTRAGRATRSARALSPSSPSPLPSSSSSLSSLRPTARTLTPPSPRPMRSRTSTPRTPTPPIVAPLPPLGRAARRTKDLPSVACIMPTCDRPEMVARSIRHFLHQSYPRRELIIVDDGRHSVSQLVPADPRIHYIPLGGKLPLGSKRNLACEVATADVIVHWDDDDWMAPGWIDAQVHALRDADADITGLSQVYFYSPAPRCAWRYVYPSYSKPWVHGATLCYTRAFWQRNKFLPVTVGEDLRFLWSASAQRIFAHDRHDLFVAYVHAANTSPKRFIGARWQPCPPELVERLMVTSGKDEP